MSKVYEYHYVVYVPVTVADDGTIERVGDPEMCEGNPLPTSGDDAVWDDEAEHWMCWSPADRIDQPSDPGYLAGWNASAAALGALLGDAELVK